MSIACTYRGVGYGFELPPGYRECEYIESTGTQWLDFEWYANGGMLCKLKGVWPTGYKQGLVMSHDYKGQAGPGYNRNYLIGYGSGSSNMEFGLSGDMRVFSVPNYSNGTTVIEAEFNTRPGVAYAKVNGVVYSSFNTSTVLSPLSTVMAFYENYNHVPVVNGRLYYCTITDVNDVVVRDLIPCLDYNGVPGMFDKITGKTFYNKGTGEFKYKPKPFPFPNGYTELEYLESTGTQWIDTGYKPNNRTQLFLVFNWVDTSNYDMATCYTQWDLSGRGVSIGSSWQGGCFRTTYVCATNAVFYTIIKNVWYESGINIGGKSYVSFLNGELIKSEDFDSVSGGQFQLDFSMPLFRRRTRDGFSGIAKSKIAKFSIFENDVLIQDFLPYLDPEGEPCMVDVLTGKPYYNQGTGTFNYKLK